ncbi:MAG: hypothetical protein MK364_20930 [Pirellulales bacterium]|nr:hypothetical protein [Pirellulales bacterium]
MGLARLAARHTPAVQMTLVATAVTSTFPTEQRRKLASAAGSLPQENKSWCSGTGEPTTPRRTEKRFMAARTIPLA